MRKEKNFLICILLLLSLVIISPTVLPVNNNVVTVEAAKIKLSKSKAALIKGKYIKLKISGTKSKVKWSSSNSKVATVKNGKVIAKKKGNATITATVNKKDYKCKITVEEPKLSKTSFTLVKGKSYTLKVNNTKQSVKWTTSNKNVATVNSKGKITANKKGNATITATVLNKKYTCKVTVKNSEAAFNENSALKNISAKSYKTPNGVILTLKNNYTFDLDIACKIVYFDANKNMLDSTSDYNYCFEKGRECALFFYGPQDSNYNYIDYSTYKISYQINQSLYSNVNASKIKVTSNKNAKGGVTATVKNTGINVGTTRLSIVYYKNSVPIFYNYTYAHCEKANSIDYINFDAPYDKNYDTVNFDSYKIYVNHSYSYN